MIVPLVINILATIAILGGLLLDAKHMLVAWAGAAVGLIVITLFYPEYWTWIGSLTG